jgi:hypothetical protein
VRYAETTAVEPPPIEQPAFSAASKLCARMSLFVGNATAGKSWAGQWREYPLL